MSERIYAAVLAGGESRRFGADKAMADLGGAPMIVRVGERLRVGAAALAVVGGPDGAAALGCLALSDPPAPVRGPLLGVLAGLEWARAAGAAWLLTAPCDVPFLPDDFLTRLHAAARENAAPAAFAATRSGVHALCALWSTSLAEPVRMRLEAGDHPAVRAVAPDAPLVMFEDEEAFANINTQADFERVKARFVR